MYSTCIQISQLNWLLMETSDSFFFCLLKEMKECKSRWSVVFLLCSIVQYLDSVQRSSEVISMINRILHIQQHIQSELISWSSGFSHSPSLEDILSIFCIDFNGDWITTSMKIKYIPQFNEWMNEWFIFTRHDNQTWPVVWIFKNKDIHILFSFFNNLTIQFTPSMTEKRNSLKPKAYYCLSYTIH